MTKNIIIGVLIVTTLIFGGLYFNTSSQLGAAGIGPTHYQTENFLQGAYFGKTGQSKFSNTGTLTIGSGGTAITKFYNGTRSFTIGTVASATPAGVDVTVTGVALGDTCFASIATSTNVGLMAITANVSSTNIVNVLFSAADVNAPYAAFTTTTVGVWCIR